MQTHEITLAIEAPTIDRADAEKLAELIQERVSSLLAGMNVSVVSVDRTDDDPALPPAIIENGDKDWSDKPTIIVEIKDGGFFDVFIVGYKRRLNPRVVVRDRDIDHEYIERT